MRRILSVFVLLAVLTGVIFSQSAQEKAAMLAQPAIVNLEASQSFSVKLNSALFGYPELEGRTYQITEKNPGSGFFINGDGYLFSPSSIIPQPNETAFLSDLAAAITNDAGRIQHIKLFGSEPNIKELSAFSEYLFGLNGGAAGFSDAILSAINSGNISVVQAGSPQLFAFFNGSSSDTGSAPESLIFINETDGLIFAKADGKNFLTLGLSNDSNTLPNLSNGDILYVATFNDSNISIVPIVATVAPSSSPATPSVSSPSSGPATTLSSNYFPPYLPGIVFDSSSRVWGISSGGNVVQSSEVVRASNRAGVTPSKSDADKSYEQGMTALWEGENQMAEFFLEEVAADSPKQSGAIGKHLGSARSGNLEIKIPQVDIPDMGGFSWLLPFLVPALVIFVVLLLAARFIFGRRKGRGAY